MKCIYGNTACVLSLVQHFVIPWTVVGQAPLSMGFFRQEYWSGFHFLFQRIFLTQGWNLRLLHWQVGSLPLSHSGNPVLGYPKYSITCKNLLNISTYDFNEIPAIFKTFEQTIYDRVEVGSDLPWQHQLYAFLKLEAFEQYWNQSLPQANDIHKQLNLASP